MPVKGHQILGLSEGCLLAIKTAIAKAEQDKKHPPYTLDIYNSLIQLRSRSSPSSIAELKNALLDLYRNDELLADTTLDRFSLDFKLLDTKSNEAGFDICSQRMTRMYPTYIFDD